MVKCRDCKFFFSDIDSTCYKKFILNEFTGEWEFGVRKQLNNNGQCKDFKKINKFFGIRII